MNRNKKIQKQRLRRTRRVRKDARGNAERPRLSVFRSHKHIYAQLIDDAAGNTLCASSSRAICGPYGGAMEHAKTVGADLAAKAKEKKIKVVRFDRGPYRFHGRVRALAEAAREQGLEF